MKTRPGILLLLVTALAPACFFIPAQAAPITVDSTTQGPMNGFELYGNGLYWWNHGNYADEIFPARTGQIAIRSLLAGRYLVLSSSQTYFAYQSTSLRAPLQSTARTDDNLFYFADSAVGIRINRRAIYGANPPEIDFSGVRYNEAGSILVHGSTVYWNARGGAAANNGEIRWKSVNGGPGGGDAILGSGVGLVKKMKVIAVVDEDGNFFANYLYLLNTFGELWRIRLPSLFNPFPGTPSFFASNVTDFDAREEIRSEFTPPFLIRRVHGTKLYAATGVNLGASRISGRVVVFDLTSGGSFTEYDSQNVDAQITGVALDGERIFITRTPLRFEGVPGGFGGWVYDSANAQILRKYYPANSDIFLSSPYETIAVLQEGGNLRSDVQWLYYTHQNLIRKIRTDAPAVALDYRAIGFEVVQAVQDFNNSVPIVAGKPTLVRGYAQLLQNTTGIGSFPVFARLRAFRGGVQLPGEAYSDYPLLDGAADLRTIRTDVNRNFFFDLPQSWLDQAGTLRLEMTVNPNLSAPETGETPLANNTVSANVTVNRLGTPCLIFVVMSSTMPNYDPNSPGSGLADILDRALTQLPAPGFRYGIRSGSFTKPVVTLFGIKGRSWNMPDDANWALTLLSAAQWLSKDPAGCPDTHWVGMFPSGEPKFNGLGETPGNTLLIRMGQEQSMSGTGWTGPRGGFALAHELGHNYGRQHINTPTNCTTQVPDGPYDGFNGDPCTLGVTNLNDPAAPIGYDYRTGQLILPNQAGDLMTYSTTRWISPQNWRALVNAIPGREGPAAGLAPSPAPPPGPVLFVQGFLNTATGTGLLLPAIQGEPGVFDDALIQASIEAALALPADSPHRVRLLDAKGATLLDYPAVTTHFSDGPREAMSFQQFLPHDPAAVRVQLVMGGAVVAEAAASANVPLLALESPVLDGPTETLTLNWAASDADGDPLLFTVQFSPDDGATWQTLRVLDPSPTCTIGTRLLPGGDTCRLRVIASDGFNTTIATTDAFALAKHAPGVSIAGVRDQQQLPYGSNLTVRAFAYDAEDGSLDPALSQWSVAGPEVRTSTGATLSLRGLAPGTYALTASASDADGNTGSTTLTIEVLPLVVGDSAAPAFDGLCADSAYAATTEVRLIPGLVEPTVRFARNGGYLYVCFNGLPLSDPDVDPANINFYINSNGAPDSAPQTDDIGFGVDENGVPAESRGNGAGLVAENPVNFSVQTMRSLSTWSAEFRIPEGVVGGWNHNASIAFFFGHSRCLFIPFIGCISLPDPPVFWPASADLGNPSTWSAISFGPLPATVNRAPVAIASGPGVVSFSDPQNVALDGAGSYDLDGDALAYSWTQTDGPSVTLQSANSAGASFITPELSSTAVVKFQLTVNDGQADSAPAEVSIALAPAGASSTAAKQTFITVSSADGSATIQLCWPGSAGDLAVIQASTDLVTWENIDTNTVGFLQAILFTDASAGLHPHRFYRAVSWQPATAPGNASLQFDGTDDLVEIPHEDTLNALPLTITAWFKTTQATGSFPGIVTKYEGGAAFGYAIGLDQGRLSCWYYADSTHYLWDGGAGAGMPFVAEGQWHHVAYVVDPTGGRVYLDGTLVNTHAWVGAPRAVTTSVPLRFGAYFGGTGLFFNGQLEEVSLWSRVLAEAEINRLIPGQLGGGETGLLGYWRFDEGAGESAGDVSGHGHDGMLQNGPAWVESTAPIQVNPAAGSALKFDGVNDSVRVAHAAALNAFPLTVAAWIKTSQNSPGYVSVANKYVAGSGNGYSFHIHNGRLYAFYFRGDGASYIYAADPGLDGGFIADGRWHHVAYVVDANGGRIYVDGVERASLGWTGAPGPCTATTPVQFGPYPLGGQVLSLAGRMEEVTLWERALSQAELQVVMHFTQTGDGTGLLGHWRFDDDSGTTATDATGHGYDGTLLNGPIWVNSDAPIYQ